MVISTPFMEEEKSAVSPVTSGMVSEFPASSSDRRSAICPVPSPSLIHEKINDLSSSFSSPPSVVISSHRSPSTVSGASDGSPMMERLRSGTAPSLGTVSPCTAIRSTSAMTCSTKGLGLPLSNSLRTAAVSMSSKLSSSASVKKASFWMSRAMRLCTSSHGSSVDSGLPARTTKEVSPSLPPYSPESHAAVSLSPAWSFIWRTTARLLPASPFHARRASSISSWERGRSSSWSRG